ncbi:MAG TPA: hypothetical protein VF316_15935 [Polyangiaceae bacterium]
MNSALAARLHLLACNREWTSVALARVMADGGDAQQLVVLILDTTDEVGRGLARALAERHPKLSVEHHERVVLGKGQIPTVLAVIEVALARSLLAESNPSVAARLTAVPPGGRVRVVSISEGGAVLVHAHVEPARTTGSA